MVTARAGFLLAVLWFDLNVRLHEALGDLPPEQGQITVSVEPSPAQGLAGSG